MKRQFHKVILLPADKSVLYNSDFVGEQFVESYEYKYFKIFGLHFPFKKKILVIDKINENNFQGDLWAVLKQAKQNGYKIIIYKELDSELSSEEINNKWNQLHANDIVDIYLEINDLNDFFKAIYDYSINPQNSIFVVNDYKIVEFIASRYLPKDVFKKYNDSSDLRLGFYMLLRNESHVNYKIKIDSVGKKYLCKFLAYYSQLNHLLYASIKLSFMTDVILYFEDSYQENINEFIRTNLKWIQEKAIEKGCKFIYLPSLDYDINKEFQLKYLKYFYPNIDEENISKISLFQENVNVEILQLVISKLNFPEFKTPALIRNRVSVSKDPFEYSFYSFDEQGLRNQFEKYFENIQISNDNSNVFYQTRKKLDQPDKLTADERFENDANLLADDIIQKINYLKSVGLKSLIAEIALRMMDGLEPEIVKKIGASYNISALRPFSPTISRLRIEWTSKFDFQIILPDYGNMIVEMPRLPKAIFYFFLQHPEGILFNELPDYESELLVIYSRISNLSDQDEIRENIKRLVDPLDNSINVNCSRIKNSFVNLIDDNLAKNYYITGLRGKPKMIALSRDMVDIKKP